MLSRLLAKAKSLLGLDTAESPTEENASRGGAAAESTAAYECAVCGTEVSDPEGTCPLCRSSDVVAAGETGQEGGGAPGNAKTTRSRDNPDEAAERLRKLREEQEENGG